MKTQLVTKHSSGVRCRNRTITIKEFISDYNDVVIVVRKTTLNEEEHLLCVALLIR